MAKEISEQGYHTDSIPEEWKDEIIDDMESEDGYKKYFSVEGHDDPFCTQEEFEFWVMEKEAVMPNGYFHDEKQDIEDISLAVWLKREGKMEIPADLVHVIPENIEEVEEEVE